MTWRRRDRRLRDMHVDARSKSVEVKGIEPLTLGLQSRCSPAELNPRLGREQYPVCYRPVNMPERSLPAFRPSTDDNRREVAEFCGSAGRLAWPVNCEAQMHAHRLALRRADNGGLQPDIGRTDDVGAAAARAAR